jgi:2-amino-4-hydroxy-6-hydroxymethyldihydropteridine diphosphokinase
MVTVYIGLGTNMGNKRSNLRSAAAVLSERVGEILSLSTIYETEPWGFQSENVFLNAALVQLTRLTPLELLDATRMIEIEMGRIRKSSHASYHDRIIDIDILMYGDLVLETNRLVLPHPLMHTRKFVMEPLAEIAPAVIHPVFRKSMEELYNFG